jgi:hypothetical protein
MRNIMDNRRNPANGRVHGEYTWCSQCEQARLTDDWARGAWYCPARCGGTGLDALPWEFVRQAHPEYPEQPRTGKHYLWYGGGMARDSEDQEETGSAGRLTSVRVNLRR